jgi:hypothetical protein
MSGIMCKNCGHKITEEFRFRMFVSEEQMRKARLERPIRWVHIAEVRRVKAYPTDVVCDAMYYGNTCMHLPTLYREGQKPVGCGCQSPALSRELEEFCFLCDKPLYDIMPSQGIDMLDHREWHRQNPTKWKNGKQGKVD